MKRKFSAPLLFFLTLTLTLCGWVSAQTMSAQGRGGAGGTGSFSSGVRRGPALGVSPGGSLRHSKPLRRNPGFVPGFFTGDGGDVTVSIDQTQPSVAPTPEKPSAKKYYVPPRWVSQNGVEVLMPSFWTDDPQLAGVKSSGNAQPELNEY